MSNPLDNSQTLNTHSSDVDPTAEEQVDSLSKTLHGLVPRFLTAIEAFGNRKAGAIPSVATIVRALLVAGAGKGYEPAVKHAIRYYVFAFQEANKWHLRDDVSESDRADNLAAWNRELRDRSQTLKLLEVEVIEVRVGQAVDVDLHAVNSRSIRQTDDRRMHNKVAEVKSPAFKWVDDRGNHRVTHAEVIAYEHNTNNGSRTHAASGSPYQNRNARQRTPLR